MYTNYSKDDFSKLTDMEKSYFLKMAPQSGVLFLMSKPGLAKSSIARSIAKKMSMQYMDIRLSMVDETDVGLFPNLETHNINGEDIKVLGHAVPKWAIKANQKPTIIHFEELNRASLSVRNAALQLLLEREIGTEFKFNDNVLMLASGNMGEDDGTDVEEFDAALNNRLIHVDHHMDKDQWINGYAKENVNPFIVSFIDVAPEWMYKIEGNKNDESAIPVRYATPRTWTFLSDFLKCTLGTGDKNSDDKGWLDAKNVLKLVQEHAYHYIGSSAQQKFARYLEESMNLTIMDVINNYNKVKSKLESANRDRKSELLQNLKDLNLKNTLKTQKQISNLISFLDILDEDETVSYLCWIVDELVDDELKEQPYKDILENYKGLLGKIAEMS